ncbi:hypothetical protein IMG5_135820 [Ichthyophthirius multifiliis]|uniref:Uncharacterized protein n=1 Tax=Ichthyophthirius multifiliis TaxID=5932 RepID=G0QWW5_ICHMU|nr:hypothetical protein IMG5_135820 [Ichthyophthirius multifiliis]EGR30286.1 hypothetical protein IMG5_135820 [Ichthyophthirius multifiliis]|eukprot:XP_004031873.1 hypothetical protein IMG5_135820 [Ichthyophthirius multifiliis]
MSISEETQFQYNQSQQQSKYSPNIQDTLLRYNPVEIVESPPDKENYLQDPLDIKKRPQLPTLDQKPTIEDILNSIFPPRKWEQDGKYQRQTISCQEASRLDLQELEETVNYKLKVRQARKNGICPVREDLHNQLFDEIIRQNTINCPERGLLLLRVRDNLRMTFAAYQTLYQGSVVFGVRKALQAEKDKPELQARIEELDKKKIFLQNRQIILENELSSIEESFKEIKAIEEERRQNETNYLKNQTKSLEQFLKSVQNSI